RLRRFGAKHVDLPRHQILHHRRAAAVGNELKIGAGLLLEVKQANMRGAAGPTVAAEALPGFALSQAISSWAFFGGSAFLPMIISGVALIRDTGCISSTASCAAGYIAPAPTWLGQFPMMSVEPSGAACAARGG